MGKGDTSGEKEPGKMGTFWVLKVSYWLKHGESEKQRREGVTGHRPELRVLQG